MSETWATALLGLNAGLLFIGFGLPAAALELAASAAERRAILRYRSSIDYVQTFCVLLCGFLTLLLVARAAPDRLTLMAWVPAEELTLFGLLGFGVLAWRRAHISMFSDALRRTDAAWRGVCAKAEAGEAIIEDVCLLGVEASSLREKDAVLAQLAQMGALVQASAGYRGLELSQIATALSRVADTCLEAPELQRRAVLSLRRWRQVMDLRGLRLTRDDRQCAELLGASATKALRAGQESVALEAIDSFREGEWGLLEILRLALETGQSLICAAAFRRAHAQAVPSGRPNRYSEVVAWVAVGMVGAATGESGVYWGRHLRLAGIARSLSPTERDRALKVCLELHDLAACAVLREMPIL